jgi:hypothetical protein
MSKPAKLLRGTNAAWRARSFLAYLRDMSRHSLCGPLLSSRSRRFDAVLK